MGAFAYVGNNPLNATDPTGMVTDIFVGGNRDRMNRPMGQLRDSEATRTGRNTPFVRHGDKDGLVAALQAGSIESGETGAPLNVICHSQGCSTAMEAIRESGAPVDVLVTLDPVDDLFSDNGGDKPGNVGEWRNVEAEPSGGRDFGDRVAQTGNFISGEFDSSGADDNVSVDTHHGYTYSMYGAAGDDGQTPRQAVDDTYE